MSVVHRIAGRSVWPVILAFTLLQSGVGAYEVETHSNISREAYRLAKINDFLAEQLGVSPGRQLARGIFPFQDRRTVERWLRDGSIDEDNQLRHLNHFYDPIHNRGLTVSIPLGQRSHEWGLEDPQEIAVNSAFGEPSGAVTMGSIEGVRFTFLARHGAGHPVNLAWSLAWEPG